VISFQGVRSLHLAKGGEQCARTSSGDRAVAAAESRLAAERANRSRRRQDMKWGGYNRKGEERMKKMLGGRAMYVLLTIAGLALLLAESVKWCPGGR